MGRDVKGHLIKAIIGYKISKQDVYSEMKGLSSLISLTLFLAMSYIVQNVSFEPLVWKTRVNLSLL